VKASGKIFVISGPSGSGKTTLAASLLDQPDLRGKICRSVSVTTRPPRTGERNKRDYFFISEAEFKRRLKAKKILEWTRYLGYYYGTDKDFVEDRLLKFEGIVLCLDVVGAMRLKKMYRNAAITIFILPPSRKELYRRIRQRSSDTSEQEIAGRLAVAREEIKAAKKYDYRLVNRELTKAIDRLKRIVRHNLPDKDED
jgi:guanylate kinase